MWHLWYTDNITCLTNTGDCVLVNTWKNTILPQNLIIAMFKIDHYTAIFLIMKRFKVREPVFVVCFYGLAIHIRGIKLWSKGDHFQFFVCRLCWCADTTLWFTLKNLVLCLTFCYKGFVEGHERSLSPYCLCYSVVATKSGSRPVIMCTTSYY